MKLSKVRIHWWGSHCLAIAHYNLRMDISSPAVIDGLRTHWRSQTERRQKWPWTISGQTQSAAHNLQHWEFRMSYIFQESF
jgi:hypothetical protein